MEDWTALGDVPVRIEVELGRLRMRVRDILKVEIGSLIELSRAAGENVDIRAGGALIGFGEIVLTENSTAVRITDFQSDE